jgi:glycogen(starch) synthase
VRVALLSRGAYPLHPPGGLERAVHHLALHLEAQGVRTLLVTRPPTRDGTFPGEVLSVPYLSFRAGPHGKVLDRTFNYPGFAKRVGDVAASLVRGGRVDIVHAHGLTALGYGRLRRRDPALRAPLVMNPHGMEEHKARGLKGVALTRLRLLSREAARLSDRVIATDEGIREEVRRLLGVGDERIEVLPNGIDPDEIALATPADPRGPVYGALPALREAAPLFVSVGRLEAYKGFSDVLNAFRLLAGELPKTWAWVVVGEGPEKGRLQGLAHKGRLGRHVHFAGRADEALLHALYARADVFVHAPRFEGSSLVTLEAMAHGLPVVATRAGGIPDKVIEGETGLLVAPGDVSALARSLLELGSDPGRRAAMGQKGRERVLAAFSWPVLARRTIALYEKLLRER